MINSENSGAKLINEARLKKSHQLDILVNNAAELKGTFEDVTESDLDFHLNIIYKAPVLLTTAALPHLAKSKRPGAIANLVCPKPFPGPDSDRLGESGFSKLKFGYTSMSSGKGPERQGQRQFAPCLEVNSDTFRFTDFLYFVVFYVNECIRQYVPVYTVLVDLISSRCTPVVILVLSAYYVTGFRSFRSKIPNGHRVPHPCKPDQLWEGVGHFLDVGTGARNPFGLDFAKENYTWTRSLCSKDSDGDGLTNGQELGDPDCTWRGNSAPKQTAGITHPGICDPWNSSMCITRKIVHPHFQTQGAWLKDVCKTEEFHCPWKNETGIQNINLRLPESMSIPAKVTTYMCHVFDLEQLIPAGDYHIVAVDPIIDNVEILHHIILYGCKDDPDMPTGSFECGMVASDSCRELLSLWSVGLSGDCAHDNAAVRIGHRGYKYVAVQLHWNNPNKRSDLTDRSGLNVYYTPNLRTYDAGIIALGSIYFVLPPRRESVTVKSTCTAGCTRNLMKGPINVTMALNHMHYSGTKLSIEVIRNNSHLLYLTNDPVYNYDSPQVYTYSENPVQLLPGDEFITTCTFSTLNRNHSTLQGDGTMDEMCFGFLTYYPKSNLYSQICVSGGPDVSLCDYQSTVKHGCPELYSMYSSFILNNSRMYKELVKYCRPYSPCLEECVHYLLHLHQSSRCYQGELYEFIKAHVLMGHEVGRETIARLVSCETEVYAILNSTSQPAPQTGSTK
ncbi:hypothetical protein Btru_051766 [Bulinus truncatus]|nr:hypothetical protein Btru_051766 [Bulinus truncatus]